MRVTSRVVYIKEKYRGLTGTIVRYDSPIIYVELDNGELFECGHNDILAIDDINGVGKIEFEIGMKIYDVQLNMVGEVIEVERLDDFNIHTIYFEDGRVLSFSLFEEFNYRVIE